MKKLPIVLTMAFIISITASNTFAVDSEKGINQQDKSIEQSNPTEQKTGLFKRHHKGFDRDPIKHLEEKKENILKEYNEGKISKEKADELIQKIDKHIAKIKEFNSLPISKKKEQLMEKAKASVEQMIKDKKITKEEAKTLIKNYEKKLEKWDGVGFPRLIDRPCDTKK